MFMPRRFPALAPIITLAASALTAPALAQPADRPAAFTQAINTASAVSAGWHFYEAKLENDDGVWIFDIEFFSLNGSMQLEYELDASTFAILKSETNSATSAQQAEFAAIITKLGTATVTPAQAIAAAAPRTPAGAFMDRVEREIEHTALVYKFDFSNGQRVLIDATTGEPASSGGGTPTPPNPGDPQVAAIIQAALTAYPNARILEVEFESSDNRWEVKLLTAQGVARKLRISTTGAILSDDLANRSREEKCDDRLKTAGIAGATITLEQAAQIAAASAPGATPFKTEWEYEHGVLLIKVDLIDSVGVRTIFVNASTGAIVTKSAPTAPAPDPAPVITPAAAVAAALAVNTDSIAIEVEMEPEGGRQFYKVRTLTTAMPLRLRENVIDGKTGKVWSTTLLPMSTSFLIKARRIINLSPTASRTFTQAQQAALTALGDGQIRSIELEPEGSALFYKIEVLVGEKTFKLAMNAATGVIKPQ